MTHTPKDLPPRTALGQASEAVTLARDLQDRIRSLESANFDLRRQNRALQQRLAAAEMTNSALRDAPPRLSMIGNIWEMDE